MFCPGENNSNLSLLVCLIVGIWCASVDAAPAEDDEVDHVALAERLFADGHLERAKQTLTRVDVNKEGLDLRAYYLVSGLIDLQESRHQAAESKFQRAIKLGEKTNDRLHGVGAGALSAARIQRCIIGAQADSANVRWQSNRFFDGSALSLGGKRV